MWQALHAFYKWYSEAGGPHEPVPLRFELKDVDWQSERSFIVPPGEDHHFKVLKQYIWDLFWTSSNIKGGPILFRVSINPYPPPPEAMSPGNSQPSEWKAVNSNALSPPSKFPNFLKLENIIISPDSCPAAPISAQHPVISHPSSLLPTASRNNIAIAPSAHHPEDVKSIMAQPSGSPSRPLNEDIPKRREAILPKTGAGTLGFGSTMPPNNVRTDRDIRGLIEAAQAIVRYPSHVLTSSDVLPRFLAKMMLSFSRTNQASMIDSHTKLGQRSVEQ
jgi:hypothetical protein